MSKILELKKVKKEAMPKKKKVIGKPAIISKAREEATSDIKDTEKLKERFVAKIENQMDMVAKLGSDADIKREVLQDLYNTQKGIKSGITNSMTVLMPLLNNFINRSKEAKTLDTLRNLFVELQETIKKTLIQMCDTELSRSLQTKGRMDYASEFVKQMETEHSNLKMKRDSPEFGLHPKDRPKSDLALRREAARGKKNPTNR